MRCNWCNIHLNGTVYQNIYSEKLKVGFCSNQCKHRAENANKPQQIITQQNSIPQKPIIKTIEKIVEKKIYVDKTSDEEKELMRVNAELIRQKARAIKREEDKLDDEEREQSERESKKWILLTLIILLVILNIATFGKIVPWIISNLFILFYVIYFFFQKKTKKVGEWLDDKLNQ